MPQEETNGRYARVIILLCFLMIFTGLGFASSTRSLFVVPVTEELSIPRSLYSFMDSFRYVATAVVNLFFGRLLYRFGARLLIGVGFSSLVLAELIMATSHHLVLFYLAGLLFGVGFAFATTSMVGYVINTWCPGKNGTIMGAVLAANGLGGALATQIVSPIIAGEHGWRLAALVIGASILLVGVVTVIFFRNRTPLEDAASHKKEKAARPPMRRSERRRVILLAACIFFTGFVLQGIQGVAVAHMEDVGLSAAVIRSALSIHMLCLTCSKFLTGFLYDRLGLRPVVLINMSGAILVTLVLLLLNDGPLGFAMAVAYNILFALALPLETVMLPIYTREFFDKESFGRMLGILVAVNTAGYALGAPFLNAVYDITGSYAIGFITIGAMMLSVLVTLWVLISVSERHKA